MDLGLITIQISSLYLRPLRRYKWQYKMRKMGWYGIARVQSTTLEIAPLDRAHTSSYWPSTVYNYVLILHHF